MSLKSLCEVYLQPLYRVSKGFRSEYAGSLGDMGPFRGGLRVLGFGV